MAHHPGASLASSMFSLYADAPLKRDLLRWPSVKYYCVMDGSNDSLRLEENVLAWD